MKPILIAGAGPVGLAAALFLKIQGFEIRVFEPQLYRNTNSRALAVNPRTLELLHVSKVDTQILKLGMPIHGAQLYSDSIKKIRVDLGQLRNSHPYLVALSQATTEKLLTEQLFQLGVEVQRGWKVKSVLKYESDVSIEIENQQSGETRAVDGSHLIACDGAHSSIREQLQVPMVGTSMSGPWYLADVPMRTDLCEDEAHINALPGGGFQFFLRVVEDRRAELSGPALWRVIALQPDFLQKQKLGEVVGKPVWESSFHVVHKVAVVLSKGQVFFAGDAAHLHSPIGARGMNLGIEDVWVLAQLIKQNREHEYSKIRHAVDAAVVHRIERLSKMAAANSSPLLWTRKNILIPALHLPPLQTVMTTTIAGLDHSVGI